MSEKSQPLTEDQCLALLDLQTFIEDLFCNSFTLLYLGENKYEHIYKELTNAMFLLTRIAAKYFIRIKPIKDNKTYYPLYKIDSLETFLEEELAVKELLISLRERLVNTEEWGLVNELIVSRKGLIELCTNYLAVKNNE